MMSEELIREIARQIVQEQLLQYWRYYLVLGALMFLGSAASAYFGSYFRKRGEAYATKADFELLIEQLRATTSAAEEVKIAIGHTDWTSKEWKTLRSIKLEELMGAVYAVRDWLDKEERIKLFNQPGDLESTPFWKVNIISGLYFPELRDEIEALTTSYFSYYCFVTTTRSKLTEAGDDSARSVILNSVEQELLPHYKNLMAAIFVIQKKAPTIMRQIVGV